MDKSIPALVAALPNMPLSGLKALGGICIRMSHPAGNKSHIVRRLTYRLQELAYVVDPQIESRIEQQAKGLFGPNKSKNGKKSKPKRKEANIEQNHTEKTLRDLYAQIYRGRLGHGVQQP